MVTISIDVGHRSTLFFSWSSCSHQQIVSFVRWPLLIQLRLLIDEPTIFVLTQPSILSHIEILYCSVEWMQMTKKRRGSGERKLVMMARWMQWACWALQFAAVLVMRAWRIPVFDVWMIVKRSGSWRRLKETGRVRARKNLNDGYMNWSINASIIIMYKQHLKATTRWENKKNVDIWPVFDW